MIDATLSSQTNPQISHSFIHQTHHLHKQDKRLDIQILRMLTIDKQSSISTLWHLPQNHLVQYFKNYQVFSQQGLVLQQLIESNRLKLIKRDGRIFFGQIHKGMRDGKGISINSQGKVYQGQFQGNMKHGKGVEIYPNGNLFIGSFKDNKKHGEGTFYWFNLSSPAPNQDQFVQYYQGEWWGGLPDGQGKHQRINGDYYQGIFKNGLKHGSGQQQYSNGDYYKGQYANGMPQGFGQYHWADHSTFRGDFKQGYRNGYGLWRKSSSSQQSYKGQYINDKKCGHGVYYWQNGWYYKGNFENDVRHGFGELYNKSGGLEYRGFWENGEQVQREVNVKQKIYNNAFRSVQINRYDPRILSQGNTLHIDRRPRAKSNKNNIAKSSKQHSGMMSNVSNIRRHGSISKSNGSYKMLMNRSTKMTQGSSKMKNVSSKKIAGHLKANLFVPFGVPKSFK